jgi:hypothetical protein
MRVRSVVLFAAILLGSVGFAEAQSPTLADIALCNEEAARQAPERPNQKATPGMRGQTREKTDPSGSVITESPDPLVTGMDAGKADDPRYRTAYRDCMRPRMNTRAKADAA